MGKGKTLRVGWALHRSKKKESNLLSSHPTTSKKPPLALKITLSFSSLGKRSEFCTAFASE
jgi:hypothetical protein